MKKAVIIGASSGIGKQLAILLADRGWALGIAGRRLDLLKNLNDTLATPVHIAEIDVTKPQLAKQSLSNLINTMGGVDLAIVSSGHGDINTTLDWETEYQTINTNVVGFSAMSNVFIKYFIQQREGHLVGISSIAGIRGGHTSPAYNASKAYISNYLQGLRQKVQQEKFPITITDVKPGFIDTAMAKGGGIFWMASPQKAAHQILDAIHRKRSHVYVTKRWRLIAWLLKILPDKIYNRL